MVNANVERVERNAEQLRVAVEALVAVLENSDCNSALYEHMKKTCRAACDENILAVRELSEWLTTKTS
jgi:hypothetical protein